MVYCDTDSKGIVRSVDDLLTTKQLQELLQVDRITIYRMLNDHRLQGFKVGGQWRFSRREIETWLQEQQNRLEIESMPPPPGGTIAPSPKSLPLSCIQTIQDVCAEALDIAAVTTELDGSRLTEVSNSSTFCQMILSSQEGLRRCKAAWRRVDNGQIHACHAGLLCTSAPVEVEHQKVAIAAGCQFATQAPGGTRPAWQQNLPQLAVELSLNEQELRSAAPGVRLVPEESLARISRLVRRMAGTFSEIGQERLNLLSRLQHISEMSKV